MTVFEFSIHLLVKATRQEKFLPKHAHELNFSPMCLGKLVKRLVLCLKHTFKKARILLKTPFL